MQTSSLTLLFALAVCAVLFLLLSRQGQSPAQTGSTLYLLGLAGTRKTRLFHQLQGRPDVKTTTSIAPNVAEAEGRKLVDVPSARNPTLFLRDCLASGDQIAFIVDASARENLYASAGLLYELFVAPAFVRARPAVHILNLQGPAAPALAEFERELRAELGRLRLSRRSSVHEGDAEDYLAASDAPFSFEEVRAARVVTDDLRLDAPAEDLHRLLWGAQRP